MAKNNRLNYKKISNSLVILHPNPKGIIQFIGSFIFGSFPNCTYKYLHRALFDKGYSLILYQFPLNPFQFNHWDVSFDLLKEQYILKSEIINTLKEENPSDDFLDTYSNSAHYLWLGHSLGCKYIILLEILSNAPASRERILQKCLGEENAKKVIGKIKTNNSKEFFNQNFIRDQPSILLAPEISNTVRLLKSDWRISNPWTKPSQKETKCLIRSSRELFNLTGVISFNWDSIAEDDVTFLVEQLRNKYLQPPLYEELEGGHFEPLGIHIEDLVHSIDQSFDRLRS